MSFSSLSTKLVVAFAAVAALGAAIGGYAIHNLGRINEAGMQLYQRELMGLSLMKEANVERLKGVVALRDAMLSSEPPERDKYLNNAWQSKQSSLALLEQAGAHFTSPQGRQAMEQLRAAQEADRAATEDLIRHIRRSEPGDLAGMLAHLRQQFVAPSVALGKGMSQLSQVKEAEARDTAQANQALYLQSRNVTAVLVLLGGALGLGLGLGISRHVTRPLARAVAGAQRMSEGDMGLSLHATGKDETAQLLQSLESMRLRLRDTVARVRGSADHVALASAQIAQGNADLSQRTEEQASALQQTAATMDELGMTVRNNAAQAQLANQRAREASAVASRGGEAVAKVVHTMRSIEESSSKITEIISVIDGIAFQTNILALNAAVEAARAGKQGCGFAVVASEVRNLAQRSAAAAGEIHALIATSSERVEQGNVLVTQARQTMDEVVASISGVAASMCEISTASHAQSVGITQVGEAIGQMDRVTQQNATLVEQCAAAAHSLTQQARQLVGAVAVFRDGAAQGSPSPVAWPSLRRRGLGKVE